MAFFVVFYDSVSRLKVGYTLNWKINNSQISLAGIHLGLFAPVAARRGEGLLALGIFVQILLCNFLPGKGPFPPSLPPFLWWQWEASRRVGKPLTLMASNISWSCSRFLFKRQEKRTSDIPICWHYTYSSVPDTKCICPLASCKIRALCNYPTKSAKDWTLIYCTADAKLLPTASCVMCSIKCNKPQRNNTFILIQAFLVCRNSWDLYEKAPSPNKQC